MEACRCGRSRCGLVSARIGGTVALAYFGSGVDGLCGATGARYMKNGLASLTCSHWVRYSIPRSKVRIVELIVDGAVDVVLSA